MNHLAVIVVCLVGLACGNPVPGGDPEPTSSDIHGTAVNTDGNTFKIHAQTTEYGQEVHTMDENGVLVATSHFFSEGYIVENPVKRNVCLIRFRNATKPCFDEEPITDNLPSLLTETCRGRERVLLKPTSCEAKMDETNGPMVEKRSSGEICLWKYWDIASRCVEEKCCNWLCASYCCAKFQILRLWARRCIST